MFGNILLNWNLSINKCYIINYFFFPFTLNFFLFFFADFFKFSNVVFSIKIPGNVCEQWDITETNNWIRLVFFDDKSWFLFSQFVSKQLISLLSIVCYIFVVWIIKKKHQFSKSFLQNIQSMRILKGELILLLNKYAP